MGDTQGHMRKTLVDAAEANFTRMDEPMSNLIHCAAALDKWR